MRPVKRLVRGRRFWAALVWAGLTTNLPAQDVGRLPELPGAMGAFAPQPLAPRNPGLMTNSLGASDGLYRVKIGQGRIFPLKEPLVKPAKPGDPPQTASPLIAVGDPSVMDFYQINNSQLRLIGKRLGTTDLSITYGSGQTLEYEIQVIADLDLLSVQLRHMFPDASLRLDQVREKIVVEGQARDAAQVGRIISTVESAIRSIQQVQIVGQIDDARNTGRANPANPADPASAPPGSPTPEGSLPVPPPPPPVNTAFGPGGGFGVNGFEAGTGGGGAIGPGSPGAITANRIVTDQTQVINLIRVPTSQQVMLKVRVAELNRTAFRQIGADFLATIPGAQSLFGTQIAGNGFSGVVGGAAFPGPLVTYGGGAGGTSFQTNRANGALGLGSAATAYGTFGAGAFNSVLTALRRNNLLKVLAEPNLVALNGHQANFLAGGEFPVPSFSGVGAGAAGGGGSSSTQFKEFGVRLAFLPIILDNETIRLTVDPEVSTIDFSIATTLVPGGSPVPGLNKRSSHTTVELKQGETLAIAGLLQINLDGQTQRLPGLGDLPFIGEFFSNTTSSRLEKELIVTITPYLVEPMLPGQVPPGPGDEVVGPNDLEFFLLNRIEGRTAIDNRATTHYDDPFGLIRRSVVEKKYLIGPSGYSR